MTKIYLHKKHGVNPTIITCFFCGEAKDILLVGSKTAPFRKSGIPVSSDGKMPKQIGAIDYEPCSECEDWMKQGVMLVSVRNEEKGNNPYRTGKIAVLKDSAIKKMFKPKEFTDDIIKKRFCFVPDEVWKKLGLPSENIN